MFIRMPNSLPFPLQALVVSVIVLLIISALAVVNALFSFMITGLLFVVAKLVLYPLAALIAVIAGNEAVAYNIISATDNATFFWAVWIIVFVWTSIQFALENRY